MSGLRRGAKRIMSLLNWRQAPTVISINQGLSQYTSGDMELVANVWPIYDAATRLVLRYLMRAYAIEAPDEAISSTLRALALSDFRLARAFPIPRRFVTTSKFGSLEGCVDLAGFHEHQAAIIAPAFEALERSFPKPQGVSLTASDGEPRSVGAIPHFPPEPYLLVTSLLETSGGQLIPQIQA